MEEQIEQPAQIQSTDRSSEQPAVKATGVQTLRGIACVLVVALHTVGWRPTTGMHMGEGTFYRNLADLFAPLRMPLFTFLSGFVYAYFPVMTGRVASFATKKLRRVGLPLLTVTTIYYLLTFVAGDVNGKVPLGEAWRVYVFPYVHLWFLQAILLIFAALVVLERVGALATFRRFAATLVCAMAAGATIGGLAYESLFSYENAIYLLPFFLLGLGANRFREVLLQPAVAWACTLAFVIAAAFHVNLVLQVGAVTPTLIILVIGFSGVMALIYFTPRWRPLERLGAYSFTIYLFHPFAVAPSRKILQALDADPVIVFGCGLVVGVLAPIVVEHLARRVPIGRLLLLGQSRNPTARTRGFAAGGGRSERELAPTSAGSDA